MISTGIPGVDELIGGLPRGELVIIAGGPGTGKTMFSAGFIYWGAAKYGEKGVYVSLAEDKETFITNMRRVGYDFRGLEGRGLFHFIDALTLMEAGTAELLEAIIEDVVSFGPQRLVIDSLSALAQGMREPRELRVFLHSLLSKIMRGLGCTTILIEEVPVGEARIGYGFEEFVASAVIILEKDMVDDKFLRRMRIEKLRGMPVPNNRACYTLGAGFIAFPPYKTPVLESPKTPEPVPDPPGRYSSGIRDLDGIMGGYSKGSTILLEIDPRITRDQYRMLIWPHPANFL
ncbi:MAG: ATPase domain-containing protein, partial [Nitrososphaerota archaeon]